jgi:DNA-binding FrmR family transcriptional regulator
MTKEHIHESHPEIVKRLRRAEGHLRSVADMIESGRPCVDVAQQLHAVEKAISQAKRTFIQDHIDHCLENTAGAKGDVHGSIKEFKEISKYL